MEKRDKKPWGALRSLFYLGRRPEYHYDSSKPFDRAEYEKLLYVINRGGRIYDNGKLVIRSVEEYL